MRQYMIYWFNCFEGALGHEIINDFDQRSEAEILQTWMETKGWEFDVGDTKDLKTLKEMCFDSDQPCNIVRID